MDQVLSSSLVPAFTFGPHQLVGAAEARQQRVVVFVILTHPAKSSAMHVPKYYVASVEAESRSGV